MVGPSIVATYAVVVLGLFLIPGPAVLLVLGRAVAGGCRVGIATGLGVACGDLLHTALATVGLSAVLMTSALAFGIVKYAGAAYLIYLGVRAFLEKGSDLVLTSARLADAPLAFRQAVLAELPNPKTALFFLAFLPQFVRPGDGSVVLQLAVLGLVFAGAVFMIGPDALGGLGVDVMAQLACLAGALAYAFAGIFGRRFRRMGVPPMATAAGQVCASTVLLMPLMLMVDRPWTLAASHAATWVAVMGVGLLSTALAYVLYFRILAATGATNLLLVTFLIPVSAILLGALVLGETLLPRHFVGMALIGAGLACIDGRLPRLLLGQRKQETLRSFDPQI